MTTSMRLETNLGFVSSLLESERHHRTEAQTGHWKPYPFERPFYGHGVVSVYSPSNYRTVVEVAEGESVLARLVIQESKCLFDADEKIRNQRRAR